MRVMGTLANSVGKGLLAGFAGTAAMTRARSRVESVACNTSTRAETNNGCGPCSPY